MRASKAWSEIERFTHELKSVAGTLGAEKLAASAERVEKACREKQVAGIELLLTALDAQMALAAAAAALMPPSQVSSEGLLDARPTTPFDRAAAALIAEDLCRLLKRRSMTARKRFVAFRAAVTGECTEIQLDALAVAVNRLDNDEALKLMGEIVSLLELGKAA
jgi:two-component system, sensor histidine kinase and response regulator